MTKVEQRQQASDPAQRDSQRGGVTPFDETERMFENFFRTMPRGWLRPSLFDWPAMEGVAAPFEGKTPKVDVVNRDQEVLVRAELPGVNKDDLDVSVTEDSVSIHAETRYSSTDEKGQYYRAEISRGHFSRTVTLPAAVMPEEAKASFNDGMLELVLPKKQAAQRHKVKVG